MVLRAYRSEDAAIICKWIRTENELYQWSADRFNRFPLTPADIDGEYAAQTGTGRFFPFTAKDDAGRVIGHFIMRYPREHDDSAVRFGFVIADPAYRGKGIGRQMLLQGLAYARDVLHAASAELGVFANNPQAIRCYASVGFQEYQRSMCTLPPGTWECIEMRVLL